METVKTKKSITKQLVLSALFTTLTMLSTFLIKIPIPLGFGYVHLGDAFVLLSAFILGPIWGTAAAGVGSAMADVFSGYALYAPATLIIKSAMALLAWLVRHAVFKAFKKHFVAELLGGIVGAVIMPLGYFLFETVLYSAAGALVGVPWNFFQGGVGILLSVIVMRIFITVKIFDISA